LKRSTTKLGSLQYRIKIHHDPKGRDAMLSEELTRAGEVIYRFADGTVQPYGDQVSDRPRVELIPGGPAPLVPTDP